VLENDHSIGSVDNILVAVHVSTKGPHLDTLEKFYVLGEIKKRNQTINARLAVTGYSTSSLNIKPPLRYLFFSTSIQYIRRNTSERRLPTPIAAVKIIYK
jgi:hypothetical protein